MRRLPRSLPAVSTLLVLALAACTSAPPRPTAAPTVVQPTAPAAVPRTADCSTCGRIERMDAAAPDSRSRPRGAVLGGVVGGVIAGPAQPSPASSGKGTPQNVRLVVLLDSGRRLILTQPPVPGMKVGSRVRVERSRAVLLR